jgi:type I restriction enzyme S subunit
MPYLTGPTDFLNGKPNAERFTENGRAFCEAGDILVVVKGSGTGAVVRADRRYAIGRQLMAVRPKSWDANFVHQVLLANGHRYEAVASGLIPGISRDVILDTSFVALPSREQKRVAEILATWDRAIENLQATVAAKKERLRALCEQLLTGTRRFPHFGRGKWRDVKLGAVLEHVFRPVEWAPDRLFRLISIRRRCGGLFRREDLLGADYKTTDLHEVRSGDFLISKRQVVHGAWGMVTDEFAGCHVSKEYSILVNCAPEVLHMPFFDWLCHQRRMWHLAFLASDGVHLEKLIFDSKDFLRHHIQLPPTIEEQQRIVGVLDACDHEICLLEAELDALKEQKRGLMENLLTGKVRVKP